MGKLREIWRSFFDIREGELGRTVYMALYLFLVLVAYYIIKPVSRAMFLSKFDIDQLPYLYILIAIAGGIMAYGYTKVAVHSSLNAAVNWCTFGMIGALVLIWWMLTFNWWWMLYVFNVFVSLFSITLVSQGWLVAANIFTTHEAKRLYGILGVGSVLGAALGGTITATAVHYIGSRNLLLASAVAVGLAYIAFVLTTHQPGVSIREAKGAEHEETFSFRDITQGIRTYSHLQIIIAIIALTYIVDVTVEFQFNAVAKEAYPSQRDLTAFLGSFYGLWLNLVTFVLQFFLTAFIVTHFGVGGALQIMPVSIGLASIASFVAPGVWTAGAARLTEAATRYSFNKTGMELLYLPLPLELRNRVKAFTDIFVDRLSRGVGGLLLLGLTSYLNLSVKQLSLVVIAYAVIWVFLSIRARSEYIATVRTRLASRRLDFENVRINVKEAATIRLLEETSESSNSRQAAYALALLASARGYPIEKRLEKLITSPSAEIRAKIYELARERNYRGFYDQALSEVRSTRFGDDAPVVKPAVQYVLWVSSDTPDLAKRLITHPNRLVARAALEALTSHRDVASSLVTKEWIWDAAHSAEPTRRMLAAVGVRINGDKEAGVLHKLLLDSDTEVVTAACETAAVLQDRMHLDALLKLLPSSRFRGTAIDSLARYGERIVGTLGDVLLDTTVPVSVRRQIPRVLKNIPVQRSVDVLLQALQEADLSIRSAALRGLNALRESAPKLGYGRENVMQQILKEARYYYEMHAALSVFKDSPQTPAARLLVASLQERLRLTVERLFRLLGLRYPPKEIYAAFLAVNRRNTDEFVTAIEFLDNVLERELKRVLLPLVDDEGRVGQVGKELYGVDVPDSRTAIRNLLKLSDQWLVACAVAAAAELEMRDLRPEIEPLTRSGGSDVRPVAVSAIAALA